jgi:hypothetical protein
MRILIISCWRYDRGCSQLKRHMNRLLVFAILCAPVASAAIRILPSPQYAEELTHKIRLGRTGMFLCAPILASRRNCSISAHVNLGLLLAGRMRRASGADRFRAE